MPSIAVCTQTCVWVVVVLVVVVAVLVLVLLLLLVVVVVVCVWEKGTHKQNNRQAHTLLLFFFENELHSTQADDPSLG